MDRFEFQVTADAKMYDMADFDWPLDTDTIRRMDNPVVSVQADGHCAVVFTGAYNSLVDVTVEVFDAEPPEPKGPWEASTEVIMNVSQYLRVFNGLEDSSPDQPDIHLPGQVGTERRFWVRIHTKGFKMAEEFEAMGLEEDEYVNVEEHLIQIWPAQ